MRSTTRLAGKAGFTLIEATAGLAATGAVVLGLSMIAGQWLPNWRHGFVNLQRSDLLSLGIERVAADLANAEFVLPNAAATAPLFDGDMLGVTFVRSAIGPGAGPRLELVRFAEATDSRGFALVRSRAPFAPAAADATALPYALGDPIALIRSPFRVSFAYAGADRVWRSTWRGVDHLPDAVRITIRDAVDERILAASTAVTLRVTASALEKKSAEEAPAADDSAAPQPLTPPTPPAPPSETQP
jgi:general secretion pathway protein J